MNKAALVDAVAVRLGTNKATAFAAVDAVLDVIVRTVAEGDTVSVTGFGTFAKHQHAERGARNPQTGERIKVPAGAVPWFRPGQGFKDLISGRRAMPAPEVSAIRKAAPGTKS